MLQAFISIMRQIPYSITNQAISQALDSQDSAFFLDYDGLDQNTLDGVFVCACKAGVKPEFIDALMSIGIGSDSGINSHNHDGVSLDAQHRGCIMAFRGYHYDLLYHILSRYGKGKKNKKGKHSQKQRINICETLCDDYHVVGKMIIRYNHLPLFRLIVELAPNHTRRIRQCDKYYTNYDFENYAVLYNHMLNGLQSQYLYYQNNPEEQTSIAEAMKIVCTRHFPIYVGRRKFFEQQQLDFLPERRKYCELEMPHYDYEAATGMANNKMLFSKSLAGHNSLNTFYMKCRIFLELCRLVNAPYDIENRIHNGMDEDYPRCIPNDIESDFLQSIEVKAHLFKFFGRYYLYERKKLHDRLNEGLIENQNDGVELIECVNKI